ncbi:MAG: hypothetical protein RLZZ241_1753 [Bacteroidota bacterium]
MIKNLLFCFVLVQVVLGSAQQSQNRVVLITLDGYRWQELFTGADPALIANAKYVHDSTSLKDAFWKETPVARRAALMPFIWNEVAQMGQIYGNRTLRSLMNLTNTMWFSYPGYNEILSGQADDARITSNDKIPNPNITVLEKYQNTPAGKGKVAAFGSWDVFPSIINEERSGVPVNAGYENATGNISDREQLINEIQTQLPELWGSVRYDAITHQYALAYMMERHPELVYISYGETDDFAHDGDYEAYLKSAHNTDGLIRQLWDFTQSDPFYRGKTTFLITTDHGRGTVPLDTWRSHGAKVAGADQVWLIAFGNGVAVKGEISENEQLFTNQLASTIMTILGLDPQAEMGKLLNLH